MQILADCHSHTENSPDSKASPASMCKAAIDLNLAAFAITDHCEMDAFYKDSYDKSSAKSVNDILECKKLFPSLNLLCGVELGQPLFNLEASNNFVKNNPYDFILASVHNPKDCQDFAFLQYTKENVAEILMSYFKDIYELVSWGKFDCLAHLTYPLRYIVGEAGLSIDISKYVNIIADIFKELIKRDIALEINTAGLRNDIGVTAPDPATIKLYRSLGGKLITLGADAHQPEFVAYGIDKGIQIAKDAGFDCFYYYKNHKPVAIPIV